MNDTAGAAATETAAEREARLAEGLSRYLGEQWGGSVAIENMVVTSAGARRGNVLFDAVQGRQRSGLCVTIMPTSSIEIMPITEEAALVQLAERGGVAVPHVHFSCADDSYLGGPFFISDRVDGETVPRRVLRLVERVGHGRELTAALGTSMARLHALPADQAPRALERPGAVEPTDLALNRLAESVGELLQPSPVFNLGLDWLERHRPEPSGRLAVVHGDIRNGNIIVDESGLAAVLDWEVAKIGDPMEDLAWPCLRTWRFGNDALEVGGFGDRDALIGAYEAAGGTFDAERFQWWKVLGTMRWGLGLAGQARAHLDRSFSNIVMAASGRRVAELEYDLLCLIRPRNPLP